MDFISFVSSFKNAVLQVPPWHVEIESKMIKKKLKFGEKFYFSLIYQFINLFQVFCMYE